MSYVLGNLAKGKLFIISAPAGTGKTTLARMLCDNFSCVAESVSFTTRKPRKGEKDGLHYHFISEAEFSLKEGRGDFLEHAHLFSHRYGTDRFEVQKLQHAGKHVMLVIDTQGAMQLKNAVEAVFIFISPPSLEILKQRLMKRSTETSEVIERRLAWAQKEMELVGQYDYHIVNDNLQIAYQVLSSILIAEEHRISN